MYQIPLLRRRRSGDGITQLDQSIANAGGNLFAIWDYRKNLTLQNGNEFLSLADARDNTKPLTRNFGEVITFQGDHILITGNIGIPTGSEIFNNTDMGGLDFSNNPVLIFLVADITASVGFGQAMTLDSSTVGHGLLLRTEATGTNVVSEATDSLGASASGNIDVITDSSYKTWIGSKPLDAGTGRGRRYGLAAVNMIPAFSGAFLGTGGRITIASNHSGSQFVHMKLRAAGIVQNAHGAVIEDLIGQWAASQHGALG